MINMAICADALGRMEKMCDILGSAIDLDPSRADAFVMLGIYHYQRQEYTEALSFFTAASSLPPAEEGDVREWVYKWMPWDYLARCHSELGMYEEALADVEEALRTSPDRQRLLANMQSYRDQLNQARGTEG